VGQRHYAPNLPTSRPTPLLGTSCHHSSLAVLMCSLHTATASQLSGHHWHTAVPTQHGRRARYILPLSTSRLTEEGEHGTSCRFPLPAATSPLPDSLSKESTYTLVVPAEQRIVSELLSTPTTRLHYTSTLARAATYHKQSLEILYIRWKINK
jgi:hypothetical protein